MNQECLVINLVEWLEKNKSKAKHYVVDGQNVIISFETKLNEIKAHGKVKKPKQHKAA